MSSMLKMYEDEPLFNLAEEYKDTHASREDYEWDGWTQHELDENGLEYEYYDDEYEYTYADEVEDGYDGY